MLCEGTRLYDCVVVGGGPAGLSASLMLARYGCASLTFHNNQPRNGMAKEIHGFIGHEGISPQVLLSRGRSEVAKFGGEIIEATVEQILVEGSAFVVSTNSGRDYRSRTVLLATGVCDIKPDFPGFNDYYGASIHHCPDCDGYEVTNKRVAVYGSGRRAAGLLKALRVWTSSLVLLTGGESVPELDARNALQRTEIITTPITALEGNPEIRKLEAIRFADGHSIPCDALFFDLGTIPVGSLHQGLGCRVDDETNLIWVDDTQQTSVPGVFAAGDITPLSRLAVMAAAEGAMAAIHIHKRIQNDRGSCV